MATFTQSRESILAPFFDATFFSPHRFNARDKYELQDLQGAYLSCVRTLLDREDSVFALCRILAANNGSINVNHVKRLLRGKGYYERILPEIANVLNKYMSETF
jgi:hypothetical protein